jgi:gas vesicle protein
MKEFIVSMYKDLEEIQKLVSVKLEALKKFARENNIELQTKNSFSQPSFSPTNNIAAEIEAQRKEIMEKMNKIKEDAQRQAQQAISEAMKGTSGMPNMPGTPGMPSMGQGFGMPTMPSPVMNFPNIIPDVIDTEVKDE